MWGRGISQGEPQEGCSIWIPHLGQTLTSLLNSLALHLSAQICTMKIGGIVPSSTIDVAAVQYRIREINSPFFLVALLSSPSSELDMQQVSWLDCSRVDEQLTLQRDSDLICHIWREREDLIFFSMNTSLIQIL